MFGKLLIASSLLACSAPALAAPAGKAETARMEEVVAADADSGVFAGAVLVAIDGKVVLDRGYGDANREWKQPNDGETRFRLASVSKQFTAAGTLLLVEDGKLALDAPVSSYLKNAPASWSKVTVRHLLNHTSGIPDFTRLPDYQAKKREATTLDAVIARVAGLPLDFVPGEGWDYSNGGYAVLTKLIETASGQSYRAFLQQRIFGPLGMTGTGYDSYEAVIPRRATGYMMTSDGFVHADFTDMSIPQGAGGLYSTTRDLLRWEQGLFGGKLLKPATLAQMLEPVQNDYAMGLFVKDYPEGQRIWHNGGIEGFNTFLGWDSDRRVAVVVLSNVMTMASDRIGKRLLAVARGEPVVLPAERPTVTVPNETLARYVGRYALAPDFAINIIVRDGALVAQGEGQPELTLMAESDTRFYASIIDAAIVFDSDAAGKVTGLTLHQGGREMPAPRQ